MGILKADDGKIEIDGKPIWENTALKQRVLCINDEWFFYPSYTVKEMAGFYANVYENFNRERYEKLGQILSIEENRQIRRLSKGMKKQVAFRLALSCMPEVLILDEPLDGLDPVMRKQIMNIIISDVAERQMTVLVSSHNLRELEDICDHVGIIHKGRMVIEKLLDDLKGNVQKLQLAFKGDFPTELNNSLDILHLSKSGSVYTLIVKGNTDEITETVSASNPLIFDKVSLTLEEIFIYELGGLGYDFNQIIV
jgi:ABC-2 type transport system ATP-binding protein